ncbi:GntR family transcriptional regulator [Paeniglutamicibacter sp. NPDC012692]|uniref:GntR family transcriptional regulator n=1 Tax=Paeniglutamicibacter sp. NPDC012692 TaxID=3364388 RepID=UPI0036A0D242
MTEKIERTLLRDVAYTQIMEAIVNGVLKPGEHLKDDELAQWLGMSRAPIRDALGRLVGTHVVEMVPNRYTRVAPIDPIQIAQAVVTQLQFFCLVIEQAFPNLDKHSLALLERINQDVVAAMETNDSYAFVIRTGDYLRELTQISGNKFLYECIQQCAPMVNRIMDLPESIVAPEAIFSRWLSIHAATMAGNGAEAIREIRDFMEPLQDFLRTRNAG